MEGVYLLDYLLIGKNDGRRCVTSKVLLGELFSENEFVRV